MILNDSKKLAAVDLGSGSFHLAIAQQQGERLKKIASISETLHLQAGLDETNQLSDEVQLRALECLERFAGRLSDIDAVHLRVVATNTLRQAINSLSFIQKANALLPVPIEIISGKEEARLVYLGVANTCVSDQQRLVVDIGGGSTKLIIGKKMQPLLTQAAQIGYVNFTQRFFIQGNITAENFERAVYAAQKEIIKHANEYKKQGFVEVVGASNAIKTIKQAITSFDRQEITLATVEQLKDSLINCADIKKIDLAGVKTHKKTYFPASVAILLAIMKVFGIRRLSYCDGALREGVMYDLLARLGKEDVRDDSIKILMDKFLINTKQAKRVSKTALNFFQMVRLPLQLSSQDADILQRAALLHEIGFVISHSDYHRHGSYMLRHTDMAGFSRTDQQMLATLVRYHRQAIHDDDKISILRIGGQSLLYLTLLLRLAVVVHHRGIDIAKKQIQLSASSQCWQIFVQTDAPEYQACLIDLQEEIFWFARWGVRLEVLAMR